MTFIRDANIKAISIGLFIYIVCLFAFPLLLAVLFVGINEMIDFETQTFKKIDLITEEAVWYLSALTAGYAASLSSKHVKLRDALLTGIIIFLFNFFGTVLEMFKLIDYKILYDFFSELLIVPLCLIGAKIQWKK